RERLLAVFGDAALVLGGVAPRPDLIERVVLARTARIPIADHETDRAALRADLGDLSRLLRRGREDRHRARVVEDVRDLLRRQRWIDGDVGQAGREAGVVRDRPLGPVLREYRDAVAAIDADLAQPDGNLPNAIGQLPRRDGLIHTIALDLQRVRLAVALDRVEEELIERAWLGSARSTAGLHDVPLARSANPVYAPAYCFVKINVYMICPMDCPLYDAVALTSTVSSTGAVSAIMRKCATRDTLPATSDVSRSVATVVVASRRKSTVGAPPIPAGARSRAYRTMKASTPDISVLVRCWTRAPRSAFTAVSWTVAEIVYV